MDMMRFGFFVSHQYPNFTVTFFHCNPQSEGVLAIICQKSYLDEVYPPLVCNQHLGQS